MSKAKNVYLIAKYFAKPKMKNMTHVPGYMKMAENIQWDEQVQITSGLKTKDLLSAKIVLNITEQKVERNSYNPGSTFMELFEYFYKSSPHEIAQGLQAYGVAVKEEHPTPAPTVPASVDTNLGSSLSSS